MALAYSVMGRLQSDDHPVLRKLRALTESLPEGCEVEAWGHPTFRAGKKMFAVFGSHEGEPSMSVKQTLPEQQVLLEEPGFYAPPYVAKQGWIGIYVERVPWRRIEALLLVGYRHVALKRMLKALDGE